MQKEVLERHPWLGIRVYAVWLPTLATDSRGRWPRGALHDRRVTHYWDQGKAIGREYSSIFESPGQEAWDLYLLYPTGDWSIRSRDAMQAWGTPIMDERGKLSAAVAEIVEAAHSAR